MLYGIPFEYKGVCDVEANFWSYFKILTNKAMSLFKFTGLEDLEAIDERFLKEQLILRGKVCFTQFNNKLYALNGNWGGEPNAYYEPTTWIVANPILGSKTLRVLNKDGSKDVSSLDGIVVALTDFDYLTDNLNGGLYPLIYKYSGLLADNDVSLNVAQINGRLNVAFTADSEAQANMAEDVLRDYYNGKPYRVLTQDIMDKIGVNPIGGSQTTSTLMSLIEAHAHLLQDFYSEIGIASNGNMKRERINTAETELMTGCLDISVWNMIHNLKEGFDRVNELFGTSIGVELNDEVFYAGSANATLGEDVEEPEDVIEEDTGSAAVEEDNEDNDNENGGEETTENKKSEDEKSDEDKKEKEGEE